MAMQLGKVVNSSPNAGEGVKLNHSHSHSHERISSIKKREKASEPVKEINDEVKIKESVDKLNDLLQPLRTNLKFEFHEQLNEYYVAVVNPLTNEVIKEIPPKKMLDTYAAMAEFIGILVDSKV